MPKHKATIFQNMTKVMVSRGLRQRRAAETASKILDGYRSTRGRIGHQRKGMSLAVNKLHDEFHTLDMDSGWQLPEGSTVPAGNFLKIGFTAAAAYSFLPELISACRTNNPALAQKNNKATAMFERPARRWACLRYGGFSVGK
ncbi:hypothetical protein V1281_007815 [Nitrobacteraceae bacterium AZCC 2161]